jgi:hypothetical protein
MICRAVRKAPICALRVLKIKKNYIGKNPIINTKWPLDYNETNSYIKLAGDGILL